MRSCTAGRARHPAIASRSSVRNSPSPNCSTAGSQEGCRARGAAHGKAYILELVGDDGRRLEPRETIETGHFSEAMHRDKRCNSAQSRRAVRNPRQIAAAFRHARAHPGLDVPMRAAPLDRTVNSARRGFSGCSSRPGDLRKPEILAQISSSAVAFQRRTDLGVEAPGQTHFVDGDAALEHGPNAFDERG